MSDDATRLDAGARGDPPRASGGGGGKLAAVLVMVVILCVGGVAGIVLDRLVLQPRAFGASGSGMMGRRPPRGPEGMPFERGQSERFARDLGLSDAQRVKVDSIMMRQMYGFRSARESIQPRMDSLFAETRAQIESVLTPEQRTKLGTMRERGAFGRRRGGHGSPGGPRPPM